MNINNTVSNDVLDILFANRNKSYGAYQLRRTYNKRLSAAVAIMISFCLLMSVIYKLQTARQRTTITTNLIGDVITLENTPSKEKSIVQPPVIKPSRMEPAHIPTIQVTTPKIVTDNLVATLPTTQDDMNKVKIDIVTTSVTGSDIVGPPVNIGTGAVESLVKTETFDGEVFSVQQQAQFPGGLEAWKKFLEHNLRSETPADNGAAAGTYTVMVSFLVNKQGSISEVKAENDPGYGIATEAVRVIRRGPLWIPAMQNGHNVIYRQRQAITFVVAEQE